MVFSSPTTDIAFKKLFGDQKKSEITISFLNAILERKEGTLITEITINDSANLPPTDEQKKSFVDISCTDQTGKKYIIEMQVARQRDFLERAQYYTAFCLAQQLNKKDNYKKVMPVIFVGVLDFDLFTNDKNHLTHHLITNDKTGKQLMYHSEYHFIELPKFNQTLDKLVTETDKWIYLIKEVDSLDQIPRQMKDSPELIEAFDVLEQSAWTRRELELYFLEIDAERVKRSIEETAQEDRENKFKEMQERIERMEKEAQKKIETMEKEAKEKFEKGIEKGIQQVAQKLLKKMNEKEVADAMGLLLAEVKKLKSKK